MVISDADQADSKALRGSQASIYWRKTPPNVTFPDAAARQAAFCLQSVSSADANEAKLPINADSAGAREVQELQEHFSPIDPSV